MRNPKWHRDEILLALDLYFDDERGSIDTNNPKVIELSSVLNSLPLFTDRPDADRFRNPNGVSLKLSNFLAIDPAYHGKGMNSYSRLDEEMFNKFVGNKQQLRAIANEIRSVSKNATLIKELYKVEDDEITKDDGVVEGQIMYKLHKIIERDYSIIFKKKKHILARDGYLDCEACTFNFERFYGPFGKGYIECHHRMPLFKIKAETKTTLEDLALVCSNCHRMLHKSIDTLTVEDLKMKIKYDRT